MDNSIFAKVQIDHHKDQTISHLKAILAYYQESSI